MEGAIVHFDHVYKRYPGQTALSDVSFSLPRGSVIGLIGPNGSGKSTTLKLMAGLIRPNKGEVMVNGKPAGRRICREVAYLSELDVLYPFFTVEETVRFWSEQYDDFDLAKARDMLDFMKLGPDQAVKSLSKGNRGRLKIVLTVSRRAPLILMDEPLSGLDPMAREMIIKGLISFVELEEQTVILTTHEVSEVEPLLDLVVAIQEGQVLKMDKVDQIRDVYGQSLVDWMKTTLI